MNEFVVVGVLFALVALRVCVVFLLVMLFIGPVRDCPACFRETFAVRKRWLVLISRRLEWRWCPSCRWEGPARRVAPVWRKLGGLGRRRAPNRADAPDGERSLG